MIEIWPSLMFPPSLWPAAALGRSVNGKPVLGSLVISLIASRELMLAAHAQVSHRGDREGDRCGRTYTARSEFAYTDQRRAL